MSQEGPKDVVGNELREGDLVAGSFPFQITWKVIAVDPGGLHTPKGITPTKIRLYADVTMSSMPGIPFVSLIKTVSPNSQQIVEAIASNLPFMPKS